MKLFLRAKSFLLPPIRLSPKGQSTITDSTFWLHRSITATLRGLIGERMSQAQGFGLTRQERLHYYSRQHENFNNETPPGHREPFTLVSLVNSDRCNQQILHSGLRAFRLISCLTALSVFVLGKAVFLLPAVAWAWLGYELAKIEIWEQPFSKFTPLEMFGTVLGKLMIVACACCGVSTLFPVLFYLVTFGLSGWMLPFLLTGILGTYALMVRLLRVSVGEGWPTPPYQYAITCQACTFPMRQLGTTELRQHLTPPQHTEITLKSKFHEGWQCQHCLPPYHPQDLNIHLSSYILNKKGYEECPTCQTLTVAITCNTLQKATQRKPGRRTENRYCHYCNARSTNEVVIPAISQALATHNTGGTTSGGDSSRTYDSSDDYSSDSSGYSFDSGGGHDCSDAGGGHYSCDIGEGIGAGDGG